MNRKEIFNRSKHFVSICLIFAGVITISETLSFTAIPARQLSSSTNIIDLKDKKPDISGKITKITHGTKEALRRGRLGSLMVVGAKPDGRDFKALVNVTVDTLVLKRIEQAKQKSHFEDLKEGMHVEVKFKGPVLMSYPVQGTAGEIQITE